MRLWEVGFQSAHGRMSQRLTTTDGRSIAADSIRRRSRRDIWRAAKTLAGVSTRYRSKSTRPPLWRNGRVLQQHISARHRDGVEDDSGLSDKNIERFREGLRIRQPHAAVLPATVLICWSRAPLESGRSSDPRTCDPTSSATTAVAAAVATWTFERTQATPGLRGG